jgi:hypothetical protein
VLYRLDAFTGVGAGAKSHFFIDWEIQMSFVRRVAMGCSVAALAAGFAMVGMARPATAEEKEISYEKQIKPIFEQSCIKCHVVNEKHKKAASGFVMDSKEGLMKGGTNGKDIVPGNAKDSLLYKLLLGTTTVDGEDVEAMPKHKKGEEFKPLPEKKIELIKKWIDEGARF